MLITMLKGRKGPGVASRSRKDLRRRRSTAVDISGPLPQRAVDTAEQRTTRPEDRNRAGRGPTEMSNLPRELDPFESDFPWIGWTEPRHETFVHSASRSPTFDRDLNRVLAIFASES